MRVLITGIAGFVGSHLADALVEDGHKVVGVDTLATGREANWPEYAAINVVDRQAFYVYANQFEPELVIHCAASYKDPDKWHVDAAVNVEGAINAALVARHHDCPLVYFQTVLPPISSYAISKIAGERYLRLAGQPLTVYRLASIYGPRNLSGPIPTFYRRIKAGETCTVVEGASRDFVYIGDLVRRVLDDLERNVTGTFDVASGENIPIWQLPQLIGDHLGVDPQVQHIPRRPDDVASYDMTPDPWRTPKTPLFLGLQATVAAYEANGVGQTYTHLQGVRT